MVYPIRKWNDFSTAVWRIMYGARPLFYVWDISLTIRERNLLGTVGNMVNFRLEDSWLHGIKVIMGKNPHFLSS